MQKEWKGQGSQEKGLIRRKSTIIKYTFRNNWDAYTVKETSNNRERPTYIILSSSKFPFGIKNLRCSPYGDTHSQDHEKSADPDPRTHFAVFFTLYPCTGF